MSKRDPVANLLTFTLDLNRNADLEVTMDQINLAELESVLSRLGSPMLGPRIAKVVRQYVKTINDLSVET
jgi:hypothetical protein